MMYRHGEKATDYSHRAKRRDKLSFGLVLIIEIFLVMCASSLLIAVAVYFVYRSELGPNLSLRLPPSMIVLISLFMATVIGTLTAALCNRRILKPLNDLVAATRQVAEGDFDVQVPHANNHSELGRLCNSFNHMTRELATIELFRNDFINGFSHEFKTPIVSIRGFARQLQREDLDDEQRKEYTSIIISEADRLANLSGNVLLLTKLENQEIIPKNDRFSLDEQLRDCILARQLQWENKQIRLELELPEITITSNAELLAELWLNLFDNAIKFSFPHGIIEITARQRGEWAEVSFADQGVGMDEQTLQHVYDKFFQGDSAHATAGNGLGLSLARRIVQLMGGSISVESAKDVGSRFTVSLPIE